VSTLEVVCVENEWMSGTWPAMHDLIVHRRMVVDPELCQGTSCIILQILNAYSELSTHKFGTLSSYFMFHDAFLRTALSTIQYYNLMLSVDPSRDHTRQGVIWERTDNTDSRDTGTQVDQKMDEGELTKEEIEMLGCIDIPSDLEDEETQHAASSSTHNVLSPTELLLYLQTGGEHDDYFFAGLESPPTVQTSSLLSVKRTDSTPNSRKRARSNWTEEEDAQLVAYHETHGPRWRAMSREFGNRSDDAFRNRFLRINGQGHPSTSSRKSNTCGGYDSDSSSSSCSIEHILSSANPIEEYRKRASRKEWTPVEDELILSFLETCKGYTCVRWGQLSEQLPHRSAHGVRNRAYRLTERIKRECSNP
jgi:hypothetical protein